MMGKFRKKPVLYFNRFSSFLSLKINILVQSWRMMHFWQLNFVTKFVVTIANMVTDVVVVSSVVGFDQISQLSNKVFPLLFFALLILLLLLMLFLRCDGGLMVKICIQFTDLFGANSGTIDCLCKPIVDQNGSVGVYVGIRPDRARLQNPLTWEAYMSTQNREFNCRFPNNTYLSQKRNCLTEWLQNGSVPVCKKWCMQSHFK